MALFRLSKTTVKGKWPSAIWEIVDYPTLVVYQNYRQWHLSLLGITEDAVPEAQRAMQKLEKQVFATRREALQALEVALLMEKD